MAVDRGYGSGKPLSAAQSRNRRRVAKGKMTKGPKGGTKTFKAQRAKLAASPIGQLADTLLGFALPVGKVKAASMGLRAAGKTAQATALEARLGAKEAGKFFGGTGKKSQGLGLPMDRAVDVGGRARDFSESLYPRLPSRGGDAPSLLRGQRDLRTFDQYADLTNEGAGRFKSQNLLESMIQGSRSRSGMNRVKTASEVAKALAKYKAPKRGR